MVEVLYLVDGRRYDAYPVQDPLTSQITGYQLIGYGGYHYGFVVPVSQVQVVSSGTGSGPIQSGTAPSSPTPGMVWLNTSGSTVSGVPANTYAVWNGSAWVPVGTTVPNAGGTINSPTAPAGPTPGQVWFNTSGSTVSGIPANTYAVWNGSAWVPIGSTPPASGSAGGSGVTSLNNLTGTLNLIAGTGMAVSQSGNAITVTATNLAPGTPGVSAVNGSTGSLTIAGAGGNTVSTSSGVITITAPATAGGGVTSFNSCSGVVLPQPGDYTAAQVGADPTGTATAAIAAHNGTADPHPQYTRDVEIYGMDYVAQNSAPAGASVGQIWKNTNASAVSGVAAGNFGVWSGSAWVDAGGRYPWSPNIASGGTLPATASANTIFSGPTAGSPAAPTFRALDFKDLPLVFGVIATGNGSTSQVVPANTQTQINFPLEVYDPANIFTGGNTLTIPAGRGGIWEFNLWIQSAAPVADTQGYIYLLKNGVAGRLMAWDQSAIGYFSMGSTTFLQVAAGDVITVEALSASGMATTTLASNLYFQAFWRGATA